MFLDEITSKAELVKHQLSQKTSFVSFASSVKMTTRREMTDMPEIIEQRTAMPRQ